MIPPCSKELTDALKTIAKHDPQKAQAMAVRVIDQHYEDQLRNRVKAVILCAVACLVGLVIWFII